jgi:GDPmannose 4,6-dehydratase
MKRAFVTGITGQDGYYLSKLLLEKGYEVHGFAHRGSKAPDSRVRLHCGNLADPAVLRQALAESDPHEIYNLGAQSHVGASFLEPEYTFQVTALPILVILEHVRQSGVKAPWPRLRVYQASSSEMFGLEPAPQNEETRFCPQSPYAVAKVAAHQSVGLYRRAYGLFAVGGVLMNHECVVDETPVIIRRNGIVDILPIEEVVPHREDLNSGTNKYSAEPKDFLEVWDRDGWTRVRCMSATRAKEREVVKLHARAASITTTPDHVVFVGGDGQGREAGSVEVGHTLTLGAVPSIPNQTNVTPEEAWLLGALVADGYIAEDGNQARFTKNDDQLRSFVAAAWLRVVGGTSREEETSSGFSDNKVKAIRLHGVSSDYKRWLRHELYTEKGFKRIPQRILNASGETQLHFLRGYNVCDGLKEGHGTQEFKSWKTNSPTLAAGLWWMAQTVLRQRTILCIETRDDFTYYTINLNVPDWMNSSGRGAHMRRPVEEVVKTERKKYTGWLFDFATESGTFHAGIGQGWIHNSPIRPTAFVTRKITHAVARIKKGLDRELVLGNLDARRDWGFAGDYVEAMWLMLQQDEPRDFVVATGETRSVRDFCEAAFSVVGLNWRDYVRVDDKFKRPAEVPDLRGDATRIREALGWKPKVSFTDLVEMMVKADLELLG